MILDFENVLVYIPNHYSGFDILGSAMDKKEIELFKNLYFTDTTKDIFIIVSSSRLTGLRWELTSLVLDHGFQCIKPDLGATYWIKGRETQ